MEKAAVIEAGADECIAWTENYLLETLASSKALIRRYTEFNQAAPQQFRVLSQGSLFMSADYLKDADGGLQSCLKRIRRKLEQAPGVSCYIENLRGVGYQFMQNDT